MTEASFPFLPPARPSSAGQGATTGQGAARPQTVTSSNTLAAVRSVRLPAHLGVLIGLSAGTYALSLAAVTGLQSSSEAHIGADRARALAVIGAVQQDHTVLEQRLQAAGAAYQTAADAYAATGAGFTEMQARLTDLAAAVTAINGSAASLPSGVKLPAVSRSVAGAAGAAAPVVHATTTASGA